MIIGWMLPQGRLALVHGTPRRDERIDELAEVIIRNFDTHAYELMLHDKTSVSSQGGTEPRLIPLKMENA